MPGYRHDMFIQQTSTKYLHIISCHVISYKVIKVLGITYVMIFGTDLILWYPVRTSFLRVQYQALSHFYMSILLDTFDRPISCPRWSKDVYWYRIEVELTYPLPHKLESMIFPTFPPGSRNIILKAWRVHISTHQVPSSENCDGSKGRCYFFGGGCRKRWFLSNGEDDMTTSIEHV